MWPWEHLAIGYLLYSGYVHFTNSESPTTGPALLVVLGTQFPDLVDKTLAWTFTIFPSGVSVAHSVFTAAGLSACVVLLARRLEHRQLGIAFAIGYLSHIPADMVYPVFLGGRLNLGAFFWPLVTAAGPARGGFLANFAYYAVRFLAFLGTPRGILFLVLEIALLGTTAVVWILDGHPGFDVPSRFNSEIT
ncbi:metal-dependent hydrolase [Halorientalis salina]|uniref:metal-dependent hydrolase n=1 Tax=Halorientalis salina TaxID=2932266 RepID=UPI0010AC7EDE|nr:metal-dependent hydrolase [Halorientalis salina]